MELLLTGNMIDAQTALAYGLVNHVVPQDQLPAKAVLLAGIIATKAPIALSKCINAANAAFTADGYTLEVEAFGACFATDDMKEGAAAFLEKRKPIFQGK
jgi:enoyl-CoA hydratase